MSPIGRIFIVINLIMAAGFLFWASTALGTSQNWKKQFEDKSAEMVAKVAELDDEISTLKVQKDAAETDLVARSSERDQLDTQAQALRGEVEALTREKEKLSGDVSDIRNTLGTYATSIETISAAKDRAQEDAAEKESARRDAVDAQMAAEAAMRDAQDAQAQAERMLADLQAELETRRIELAHNEAIFATLRAQGVAIDNVAMPDIDAAVLDVRMDLAPGLVVLNVGADSNVQRGFVFDVYNGRTYKGRVRVENVDATMCSALIIGTADNASIQRGDRASTHI